MNLSINFFIVVEFSNFFAPTCKPSDQYGGSLGKPNALQIKIELKDLNFLLYLKLLDELVLELELVWDQ